MNHRIHHPAAHVPPAHPVHGPAHVGADKQAHHTTQQQTTHAPSQYKCALFRHGAPQQPQSGASSLPRGIAPRSRTRRRDGEQYAALDQPMGQALGDEDADGMDGAGSTGGGGGGPAGKSVPSEYRPMSAATRESKAAGHAAVDDAWAQDAYVRGSLGEVVSCYCERLVEAARVVALEGGEARGMARRLVADNLVMLRVSGGRPMTDIGLGLARACLLAASKDMPATRSSPPGPRAQSYYVLAMVAAMNWQRTRTPRQVARASAVLTALLRGLDRSAEGVMRNVL